MSLKHVVIGFAVLLLLAVTWRVAQSDWGRSLGQAPARPAPPIQFDNGTVRQYDSPASVAARSKGQPLPLGTLRKCQRGSDVSYTDSFCPPGTRELPVDKGTLNVIAPGPAAVAPKAPGPNRAQPAPTLREQAVERALNQ